LIEIDSQALYNYKRVLGTAGQGAGGTELDDANVTQVLDMWPIVRRSRTMANSTGIFNGAIRNIHAAANSQATTVNLYEPGALAHRGWPSEVPQGFDVWVLGAQLQRDSGAGNITGGLLRLTAGNTFGLGIGAPAGFEPSDSPILCAFSSNLTTGPSVIALYTELGTGKAVCKIGARIRRGFTLSLDTTSGASVTVRCIMTLGLFPEGLGQDALLY
jgi:hypothetical protein